MEMRRPLLNLLLAGPANAGVTALTRRLGGEDGGPFPTGDNDCVATDASADSAGTLQRVMRGTVAADGLVLVCDASDRRFESFEGAARLASVLGIGQVVVALNKVDRLATPDELDEARERVRWTIVRTGVECPAIVPLSARTGGNVRDSADGVLGNDGPSLTDIISGFEAPAAASGQPLRLPLTEAADGRGPRFHEGRLKSGVLVEGDRVVLSPSNVAARAARLRIPDGGRDTRTARAGDRVSLLLDAEADVAPGQLLSHVENPPVESDVFRARVWWRRRQLLIPGSRIGADIGDRVVDAEIQSIDHVIDPSEIANVDTDRLSRGQIGEVVVRAPGMLALDTPATCPANSRVRFLDDDGVSAWGFIGMEGYADQRNVVTVRATNVTPVAHHVWTDARVARHRHRGGVLWFTGLSGAGKSTLAVEVERSLFDRGYEVYVLDGDNVRHGLNADLGFSPEDRSENIRRVGEVAALFSRAGIVAISAFISPYRSDRARARAAAGDGFHEIHIKASLEVCERRDPKGLYARARSGEIRDFTGISAPYESPEAPDLVVDTAANDVASCVERVVTYVETVLSVNGGPGAPKP